MRSRNIIYQREPLFGLESAGGTLAVTEQVGHAAPFYRLIHFRRPGSSPGPPVMVVGTLSGHTSLLFHDLLAGLVEDHDLHLIEWIDAREVPLAEGDFGMEDNIAAILDCLDFLEGEAHLIGICQSATPVLAAAALRAAEGRRPPLSVTLFGGVIDPRISPTRIGLFSAGYPLSWFRQNMIATVPSQFPGHGREVHPAHLQKSGLQAYLMRQLATGGELLFKIMSDDGIDAARHPFLELYFSVMDLPATLYLDTIRLIFQEFSLPRGQLTWRGVTVDPAALTRTALMTIEGERDEISGLGQTRVAHDLCPNIPAGRRRHSQHPGVGHFGLFHGAAWRREILPKLTAFLRESGAKPSSGK